MPAIARPLGAVVVPSTPSAQLEAPVARLLPQTVIAPWLLESEYTPTFAPDVAARRPALNVLSVPLPVGGVENVMGDGLPMIPMTAAALVEAAVVFWNV